MTDPPPSHTPKKSCVFLAAIVRVEAQAEEDSEQRQLLATVAMEIMTSCSDRFRGSLKDFISALPDAAPLAACVCTLQKLGRGN